MCPGVSIHFTSMKLQDFLILHWLSSMLYEAIAKIYNTENRNGSIHIFTYNNNST